MDLREGRKRVVIEKVSPEIDGGLFAVKRTVGEKVVVEADIFSDGHDLISCVLLFRKEADHDRRALPMEPLINDRWRGSFQVSDIGRYFYTIEAWVDRFKTWRRDLKKKVHAGQDVSVDILIGLKLIAEAVPSAGEKEVKALEERIAEIDCASDAVEKIALALDDDLAELMLSCSERRFVATYEKELPVVVEREKARFSTWYEMFPRSCSNKKGIHGSFKDCEARLPYIAGMGFDVLYLPPIHPIGHSHRKGKNNSPTAKAGEPGSPWAIGSEAGGHKAVHPELGSFDDFCRFMEKAKDLGLEIALDLAFQCSPDHPYIKEHPEWFRRRPDGMLQYAENPPKKYEDIYPIHFETDRWQELFVELRSVVVFWIEAGIRIFRVDNPHTKPFLFWEWLIGEIKRDYPEVIFLSESFTRPKVMYRLAKLGFSQSYSYFAWRNTKREITQYFQELTGTEAKEFFRPNLWPNTPDILSEFLQTGGRPAFMVRLVLAATLGASYGIYGPAFELCENRAREFGSEEYLDSEKYEIKAWNLDDLSSLRDFVGRMNRIRKENPALQSNERLRFHECDSDQILCFSKHTEDFSNMIFVVINLDPHHTRGGWTHFPVEEMGLEAHQGFQVHDLLSDARFLWHGSRNYLEIDPRVGPAFVFRVRRRLRTERDFDYFM
ncbi:MAG: alpha-1,4-glucan--maltose-1-phosphate maltosyltransferase [Deltaproteobacteria bacterium]|nr:alpha-1,4-glucan--maltose-1-phosphate maltosyltransferase [Deltaproteobacteria bacterium]